MVGFLLLAVAVMVLWDSWTAYQTQQNSNRQRSRIEERLMEVDRKQDESAVQRARMESMLQELLGRK